MKLKARLLCYSAAIMLTTSAAFAAIDGNALADAYLAEGYSFVEVKVGPTQTKVEAVKGTTKVEVIYDNETQEIIKREQEAADGDYLGREGKQVRNVNRDFEDDDEDDDGKGRGRDDDDDEDDDDDDHGRGGDDDDSDDDDDDSDDDGDDDDNSGKGSDD
jgi:hypothetical protein